MLRNKDDEVNYKKSEMKNQLHIAIENNEVSTVAKLLRYNNDEIKQIALELAVESGSSAIVKEVLKYKPKIKSNSYLKTAVHGYGEEYKMIVKVLLKYGFSIAPADASDCSLLHAAVEKGYQKIVKDLLKFGANVNLEDINTCSTPIHIAVINNQADVAELLIRHGADLHEQDLLKYSFEQLDLKIAKMLLEKGATINDDCLITAVKNKRVDIVKMLLKPRYVDVNSCDAQKQTALHFTAQNGDLEIAQTLIKNGAEIDSKDFDGWTPLHFAVNYGYVGVAEILLKNSADLNFRDEMGFSPLHCAANKGRTEITKMLLDRRAEVNAIIEYYYLTPLHFAARAGHKEVVKALLEHQADVTARTSAGFTPLHHASNAGHVEIIKMLLESGSDVNSVSDEGQTTLHSAIEIGREDSVRILLEHGADVQAKTENEEKTALHFASSLGLAQSVQLLIDYGANVNDVTCIGNAALHFASQGGHEEAVTVLLENGANVNIGTDTKETALHFACEGGHRRTVIILLKAGALINTETSEGRTPLHYACEGDFVNTVKTLLRQNADVRKVDNSSCGRTALNHACRAGGVAIVKMLLKNGACVNSEDEFGRTALLEAAVRGRAEICDNLLKHGALVNCMDKELNLSVLHFACQNLHEGIVRRLLEHDVDVNVTNLGGETPLDRAINQFLGTACCEYKSNAELLISRIVKDVRKNVFVSERNFVSMYSEKFIKFQFECEEEIEQLIGAKIKNSSVSLFDILCSNTKNVANFLKNNNVLQALKSQKYKARYPIYSNEIQAQFRKGSERKKLMRKAIKMFSFLFNNLPELPLHCIVNILNFLDNQNLKSFIVSSK